MALRDLVIRSQLVPPRQRRGVLRRPRLESLLQAVLDHPLTIVHAGTGYGKSTALAALAKQGVPLAWYTITDPDRDPLLFLAHLVCAFERPLPAITGPVEQLLDDLGGRVTAAALTPLINALTLELQQDAVLVLDDYHLVADRLEVSELIERLVDYMPPRLHVVLASRHLPVLAPLTRWQAKRQVLFIGSAELAFTPQEIEALFRHAYGRPVTADQAATLAAETEGWVIALQMVWQNLQKDSTAALDTVLGRLPSSMETLFDYLAEEVLERQPAAVQRFLLTTSVLRELEGSSCDHLLEVQGSAGTLQRLFDQGLFVVAVGDGAYRYQRLFHDFLQSRLRRQPDRWQELQRRAADYFRERGQREESVAHFLAAGEFEPAALLLEEIGPQLVAVGRMDSLNSWISQLPPEIRAEHPALDLLLGDILRLRARFDDALGRYEAAEACYQASTDRVGLALALKGQAQVYVDTVRPLKAESVLEDALRLLEPSEHGAVTAGLLDLLAENKLNLGSPQEAEKLHHEARLLRSEADPGDIYLEARARLRTGRLDEGRRLLERRAEEEDLAHRSRPQRFHRETVLLLSLICALQGDTAAAKRRALEGIEIGRRLESGFVEAVGLMRLGHALQLAETPPWYPGLEKAVASAQSGDGSPTNAEACYQGAMRRIQAFNVTRTQAEPLWGLCRLFGRRGDLVSARRCADQALESAGRAGDEWLCDLVRVTMGAAYAVNGTAAEAQTWLGQAVRSFAQVGDPFGETAALLWLALEAWGRGATDQAMGFMRRVLPRTESRGWDRLLVTRTFLGLWNDQAALPLLLEARRQGIEADYAGRLLEAQGLAEAEAHPGYGLWVRTLGPLRVWRDQVPVADSEWQREKARRLFQLLLTHRGQWLFPEQIAEQLWPDLPPETASRDFRVALNAVRRALEPERERSVPSFFIERRGNQYRLSPAGQIRTDVEVFERLAGSDEETDLRAALALYEDDYLPECLYDDWAEPQRHRLRQLYLASAERLARLLLKVGALDDVLTVCEAILARDSCWEPAYQLLMQAHARAGNRTLVQSTYHRCETALRDGLGVEPSEATRKILETLDDPRAA